MRQRHVFIVNFIVQTLLYFLCLSISLGHDLADFADEVLLNNWFGACILDILVGCHLNRS